MQYLVFAHVFTMFAAVAASYGTEFALRRAARSGDIQMVRGVFEAMRPAGQAIPILFGIGVAFGLIAVFANAFNPFARWLLIAYVLFITAMALGGVVVGPWARNVGEAVQRSGGAPSAELSALLADPRVEAVFWIDWLILVAIVFDMVVKPFSS
jgi:hypothetical protein